MPLSRQICAQYSERRVESNRHLAAPRVEDAPGNANKQIAYWGDMDTWELTMLAKARSMQPGLAALLMKPGAVRSVS